MTELLETVALEPCPFCGGEAAVSDGNNGLHFRVICNQGHCRAAGPLERCAADAVSTWNTRAAIHSQGDGLREALEEIGGLSRKGYDSDRAWALAMQLRANFALKGWLGSALAAQEGNSR